VAYTLPFELKWPNEKSVKDFLLATASALGRNDFTQPLQVLEKNWVETVGDLRFLLLEGQLRTLGLPLRLCGLIEEELGKVKSTSIDTSSQFISFSTVSVLETSSASSNISSVVSTSSTSPLLILSSSSSTVSSSSTFSRRGSSSGGLLFSLHFLDVFGVLIVL
jgi:hypothetical protein